MEIFEMFSLPFIQRAAIVGLLVSLCAALLGVSMVLKRYSMIGDGLSHVGFGALAIAAALNAAPLAVSIPIVLLAAFLLLRISESGKIKGDAAIALISAGSLAIGVVIVSAAGVNINIHSYMFGSLYVLNGNDVLLSIVLAGAVLLLFVLLYSKIFAVTFDENFSRATGVRVGLYNILTALLTAVTVVLGMRMMGVLLISSLIIFPALTAMRICKRFLSVTLCSAVVSTVCFILGLIGSFSFDTPPGASIVIVNMLFFLMFWAAAGLRHIRPPGGNGK